MKNEKNCGDNRGIKNSHHHLVYGGGVSIIIFKRGCIAGEKECFD